MEEGRSFGWLYMCLPSVAVLAAFPDQSSILCAGKDAMTLHQTGKPQRTRSSLVTWFFGAARNFVLFPEFLGGQSGHFFEYAEEVFWIIVTKLLGNAIDFVLCQG